MRRLMGEHRGELLLLAVGTVVSLLIVLALAELALRVPYDIWGPVFITCMLCVLAVPVILSVAKVSDDPLIVRLLGFAVAAKLIGALVRYMVGEWVYEGNADGGVYHITARRLAVNIWQGRWTLDGTQLQYRPPETQAVAWVLGAIYSVVGSSRLGAYLIFSFIGWVGCTFFYRSFRLIFPEVRSRLCIYLLFFVPSIVYWPSSPGKEALILFLMGLTTLGLVKIFSGVAVLPGILYASLGTLGIMRIRPHISMLIIVAIGVSLLVRRQGGSSTKARVGRVVMLILLLPALFVGMGRINEFFGNESGEGASVGEVFENTNEMTAEGNSAFEAQPVRSPLDLPVAMFSVSFRPFAWEAGNPAAAVASIEGLVLLGLLITHAEVFGRAWGLIRSNPLAAFLFTYYIAFVIAFSNVANAGILARQRTQVIPFIVMLFAAAGAITVDGVDADAETPSVEGSLVPA